MDLPPPSRGKRQGQYGSQMEMVVVLDDGVLVIVGGFIGTVDMGVGVDMGVLMGVELIAVAVFVAVGMGVLMGVLEGNGVEDHQERSQDHQPKAQEKTPVGPLPQKDDAKHDA